MQTLQIFNQLSAKRNAKATEIKIKLNDDLDPIPLCYENNTSSLSHIFASTVLSGNAMTTSPLQTMVYRPQGKITETEL